MEPGSKGQYAWTVGYHRSRIVETNGEPEKQHGGHYSVMMDMAGHALLDGPYDTWQDAADRCRQWSREWAEMSGGYGTLTEIEGNGENQSMTQRQIDGRGRPPQTNPWVF